MENVSVRFEKNKNYIICGDSGVGKTTLLNIIYGIDMLDNGEVIKSEHIELQLRLMWMNPYMKTPYGQ